MYLCMKINKIVTSYYKKRLIFAQDHVKILYKTDQRIEYDADAETSYQRNYSKPPLIANTK